jgi:O-antigen/teichoic acid export membrane protein
MSFYKQTGYMGVGLVLSGIGGLVMNIGLGRVLTGNQYGIFRVFFSSILIVGWVIAFGIERDVTAQLSAGEPGENIIGSTLTYTILVGGVFVLAVVLLYPLLIPILGSRLMILPFVVGTLAFVSYRYSMGLLKGYGLMKQFGLQNVFLGIGKACIVLFALLFGWQAFESSLFLTGTFASVSLLALFWLQSRFSTIRLHFPSTNLIKRVGLSTSKQIGDVIVKFGGPVIVPIVGGNSLEAGIFAGTLTLAFIPFYVYNAIINNILPEVSALNSEGEVEGIGQRVGFLLETSAVFLLLWVTFGTLAGPALVPAIFRSTFKISTTGAFSIFFVSSAAIVSSLLTEIDAQQAVGKSWILPAVSLPTAVVVPWPPIISTGAILGIYVTAVICFLGHALYISHIPISWTKFDYTVFD